MNDAERAEFLERRRSGIGGSDAAAIVGQSPFASALDIYLEKVGEKEPKPQTPQMLRGVHLEAPAVQLYEELTGRRTRRQEQRRHPIYPFIIANIDRQILANEDGRGTGLLEVKCPSVRVFLRYEREGLPPHILLQAQHYLGVTGYDWMDFAIFSAELWRLIHFEVKADGNLITALFEAEKRFWKEHVEKRVPPPAMGMLHEALPSVEMPELDSPVIEREDAEWAQAIEQLRELKALRENAEGLEELAQTRLKELAGEHGIYEGAGARVYWKDQKGRVTFDKDRLAAAKPLDALGTLSAVLQWAKDAGVVVEDIGPLTERLTACRLDLSKYTKTGKPYESLRVFYLKPAAEDEE